MKTKKIFPYQKCVLDSCVFVAALNQQESHHDASRSLWSQLVAPESDVTVFILSLVFAEVGNRTFRRIRRYDELFAIQQRLAADPRQQIVELDESIWLTAEMIQYHCDLKTSDLLVAATAYEKEAVLVSWDKRLLQEASKVVPSLTPEELLEG